MLPISRLIAFATRASSRRSRSRRRWQLEELEGRQMLTFAAVDYPTESNPQAIVSADFNNDGHIDLATVNPGLHRVSLLLGDGGGGFGAAISSAGTTNDTFERVSVAVADFNNDGDLDLATAMYGNYEYSTFGRLDVRLGNGDGTFQSPTLVRGGSPLAVAAGDFNNDGNSDLVFTEFDGQQGFVQVLPGNGLGGFTTSGWGLGSNFAAALAVGDLNGDGNLDAVAVAGEGGSDGAAFLGNGAGQLFTSGVFFSTIYWLPARSVAVGDFTGDDIPDLVVSGGAVEIVTGLGDGAFGEPIVHSANGYEHTGVAVADFNGDGLLDAVTSDADTGTVSELMGNGSGTLTYAGAFAVGLSPMAVVVGDFNGDGRPDVATANGGSNTVSVLLNDGDWTPPLPTVRIQDVIVTEGNSGAVAAVFTVTLSAASNQNVTVAYGTGDDAAAAGSDYQAVSGTLTILAGETMGMISVPVNGDRIVEASETFFLNLASPTNATISHGQGVGTILDNEPRISISDVSKSEGRRGQKTLFTFTVTLSAAYDQSITMSYATVNGTAKTSDGDYIAKAGTITFAPGETTKTIGIEVNGDSRKEVNETFYLDLFGNSSNSSFTKKRGIGTILNDD